MPTKTISLELDAYERLKRAKRTPRESFSEVVRRAIFAEDTASGSDLLAFAVTRKHILSETALDEIARNDTADTANENHFSRVPGLQVRTYR